MFHMEQKQNDKHVKISVTGSAINIKFGIHLTILSQSLNMFINL